MDEQSMEKGEITEENNRKVKGKKNRKGRREAVLLLFLTSILQHFWLGWP